MSSTNKLELLPIGKLLLLYTLPALAGTLMNSVYNIADRVFVGQFVGTDAIAGLALTFPFMSMQAAFGMLVGAGAGARTSIVLGMKDVKWAERILGNSILLTLFFSAIFITCSMIFIDPILEMLGASANTKPFAKEYLNIVLPGSVFSALTFSFCNIMRSAGKPSKSMWVIVFGAVVNILLDYIFIYICNWGIQGAAYATVISMFSTAVITMLHFVRGDSVIHFHRDTMKLRKKIIKNILSIGMSPFLINVTSAAVVAIFANSLVKYGGDMAVGSYGIVNSLGQFMFMLIMGMCQGMQPIVGYNYGAQQLGRMRRAFRLTIQVSTVVCVLGALAFYFIPEILSRAFTTDDEMIRLTSRALQFWSFSMPLMGFQVVTSYFFQSIGRSMISITQSMLRQVIFLIPAVLVLPIFFGLDGVWLAMPVSDLISAIIVMLIVIYYRHLFYGSTKVTIKEMFKAVSSHR